MPVTAIPLPKYSLSQEIWNAISHGLGTLLTLAFGPMLLLKAAKTGDPYSIVSCAILVFAMLLMFTNSCVYHALARNRGKKVMRVIDHDMVFALIMGTYTPYSLIAIRWYQGFPWGWIVFGIVVASCTTGIVLNSINIEKYAKLSLVIQVLSGSVITFFLFPMNEAIGWRGTLMLVLGGVAQWIGAALYGIGKKSSAWFHTVFHFFVLLGVFFMFFGIYFFVL